MAIGQSMLINGLQGGIIAAIYDLVLKGKIEAADIETGVLMGAIAGGVNASYGENASVLGSFIINCSGKQFAALALEALGKGIIAGGLCGVVIGLMTHNAHLEMVMDELFRIFVDGCSPG